MASAISNRPILYRMTTLLLLMILLRMGTVPANAALTDFVEKDWEGAPAGNNLILEDTSTGLQWLDLRVRPEITQLLFARRRVMW